MHQTVVHSSAATAARERLVSPPRILVVDADADTRALYAQLLAPLECDVVEASDGRDALAKAFMHPPALVVTEVRLPFLDGFGLCDVLRRDKATAAVPILVITSETREIEIDRVRRLGADTVLLKPTTTEQILAETRRLIADTKDMRARAAVVRATAATQRAESAQQRIRLSKSLARVTTTTPPTSPPTLLCPSCDLPLMYEHSNIGGVSEKHLEQWDRFVCPASCGTFEYRHRTRKLRFRVATD